MAAGSVLAVIDGRIDNLPDLRRQLDLPSGASPGDMLTAAWLRWNERTVDHLLGDYAFALFDRSERSLWLARDPAGYRPLFYMRVPGGAAFASMPSGLHAIDRKPANLAQFAAFADGARSGPDSPFWTDILPVAPGSLVRFADGGFTAHPILRPHAYSRQSGNWDDLVEDLRARLDQAVKRCLVPDAPLVGAHLSSGLDSSAVAATAAQVRGDGQQVLALTAAPCRDSRLLVPRGRYADESALAAETARLAGIDHLVIREKGHLLSAVRGLAPYFQQPAPARFSLPWWRTISDTLREQGGQVLLTAGQGNATISHGGLFALPLYLRHGRIVDWWREMRLLRRNEQVRRRGLLFNSFGSLIPERLATRMLRAVAGAPQSPPSFVRPEWRQADSADAAIPADPVAARLAMLQGFDAGTRNRGMFALTGIEERDPTSDRELLEFSLSLPLEAMLRRGRIKPLIRDALADRVPAAVLTNRNRGVSGADWYERIDPADCRAALEEIAASPSAAELLDLDAIAAAIDGWPEFDPNAPGRLTDFGGRIGRALSAGLFLAETDRYPLGS